MVNISSYLQSFLHLLYPNVCIICGQSLSNNELTLCSHCVVDLPKTDYHLQTENPVEKLFWGKAHLEFAAAYFFFNKGNKAQKILHQLKYKGLKECGIDLGRHYGAALLAAPKIAEIDYIIPVPLHPNKLRKRGYNQSEMIAVGLSQTTNIPVNTSCLVRCVATQTQTKKGVYQRWENTLGVFKVNNAELLYNKHVLLVDDVLTTGSTIEACSNALLEINNCKVSFVSLALATK